MLTQARHEVTIVYRGNEAIDAALSNEPDLLILDYTLPGRTGRNILLGLRTPPCSTNTPVTMLTSHHGRVHSGIAEIDGADDYVTKPFDPADLRVCAEALLVGSKISRRVTQAGAMDAPMT